MADGGKSGFLGSGQGLHRMHRPVIHSWRFIHRCGLTWWFSSACVSNFECMFEKFSDVELLDVMRGAQRAERVEFARQLLAVGRFSLSRMGISDPDRDFWCVDDWEATAAEVAAELGISRGRASSHMHYGQTLINRLPKLGTAFAAGAVDFRVVAVAVYRTDLITDAGALAKVDDQVARKAVGWNTLSYEKVVQLMDWMVSEVDPDALRVARRRDDERHIEVRPAEYGMAEIWGNVRAEDGAALDKRLDELAATVCKDDPRTKTQRRADAVGAWSQGDSSLACDCGSEQCGAVANKPEKRSGGVEIQVIAEAATVEGTSDKPGFLPAYGAIPAARVRELAKNAKLRPVVIPKDVAAEPQYRPSAGLARFIRCRDLGCSWPNCNAPAEVCDIDHTTPYPLGPTHPSNCKLYCRVHHLLKTFYCGLGGWTERQLADGTLILTSPAGRAVLPATGSQHRRTDHPEGGLTAESDARVVHAHPKTHPRPRPGVTHPMGTRHQHRPRSRQPTALLATCGYLRSP